MTLTKEEVREVVYAENENRGVSKSQLGCLNCSHSFSTDDNELVCVVANPHKKVAEDHLCVEWN